MIRKMTLIFVFSALTIPIWSQGCIPGFNGLIQFQSTIDNFNKDHNGCSEIISDLVLQGAGVTNIDSLFNIESIEGSLWLTGQKEVDNLAGFANLKTVKRALMFSRNQGLTTLNDLNSLISTNGFRLNEVELTDLSALQNVELKPSSSLELTKCSKLETYPGFLPTSSFFSIKISENPNLRTVFGFAATDTIFEGLIIENNSELIQLEAFDNLELIGQDLEIINNAKIPDVSFFNTAFDIEGVVRITGNDGLNNIEGLSHVDPINVDSLFIRDNPNLSSCANKFVCDYLELFPTQTIIQNNATGCNSVEEVRTACITSIDDFANSTSHGVVILSSNPVSELFSLYMNGDVRSEYQVSFYNFQGRQVLSQVIGSGPNELDISIFPSGGYIYQVHNESRPVVQGLVIKI